MSLMAAAWLALLALCALRAAEVQATCICTLEYAPVCINGRTYGNACQARCARHKDYVSGECGKNCICTKELNRVCAGGKTFNNPCLARCNGYLMYTKGACKKACLCTLEEKPVCFEGITYSNACTAKCAGVTTFVDGECGKGKKCACPKIRAPVCAKGKTFANSCIAECNGYLNYTKGECNPPPIKCDANSSIAKCADVCATSNSPCAKSLLVDCVINPCSSATYLGTKLKNLQCKPIFVNMATSKVEKNCNKPLPPLVCAPGSPTAKCKGDPCELTTASCKGNDRYVCLGNSCGELTYLGTKLTGAMCTAIFVDPLTRKVVPECIAQPPTPLYMWLWSGP